MFNLTGNFALDTNSNFVVGENFTSSISLSFDANEKINSKMPVLISLIKDNSTIIAESLSIEEFLKYSKQVQPEKVGDILVFSNSISYEIDLGKIIKYSFEESGKYEIFVSILELNLNKHKYFSVQENI